MFIQTEATPNPATLKFLPGRAGARNRHARHAEPAAAAQSPLAERLFDIPSVGGVFFGSDFISVTKTDGEWQQLKPAILGAIMEHFMSGAPLLADGARAGGRRRGRILRRQGRRDRRHHQGPDRDARAPGGRQRRRRHHLPRLQGRHRLSHHEGRLLGLPVLDRDAAARHPEPAQAFRARRGRSAAGVISCHAREGGHPVILEPRYDCIVAPDWIARFRG